MMERALQIPPGTGRAGRLMTTLGLAPAVVTHRNTTLSSEVRVTKCSEVGCGRNAVGGFRETISVSNVSDRSATISGMKTSWCNEHEKALMHGVAGKRGAWLTPDQLKD